MSIIRQRKKNLIMAGLLGAVITGMIGVAIFIVMQLKVIDLQEEVTHLVEVNKALEEVPKEFVYIFNRSIEAGEEIKESDLKQVEMEKDMVPIDSIKDKESVVGYRAKVNISKNLPVTQALIFVGEDVSNDLREKELSVLFLPQKLKKSDYVDIRITFPNGEDFVVLSKKQIMDIQRFTEEGEGEEKIWIYLGEEELLRLSSAIVDAFIHDASLYAINYILPEVQKEAIPNYPVNEDVYQLMLNDPNILDKAYDALEENVRKALEMDLYEFETYEGFLDKEKIDLSGISSTSTIVRKEEMELSVPSNEKDMDEKNLVIKTDEGLF